MTGYENAVAYPYTNPSMFETHSLVDLETGKITGFDGNIRIAGTSFSKSLPGSLRHIPTYDVLPLNNEIPHLEERIAVMAIGSNCSPSVMFNKLSGKTGGHLVIAQAEIENHAIVHGAFLGAAGTVPATIMQHEGSTTQVTIGFLTPEQAEILTGTEPNYDVVQSGFAPRLSRSDARLIQGAAMYVSPWGALTIDHKDPLALKDIPSRSDLAKLQSIGAMTLITGIVEGNSTTEAFFNSLPNNEEKRLKSIFKIQSSGHSLPVTISGSPIWKASIASRYEDMGEKFKFPSINYK